MEAAALQPLHQSRKGMTFQSVAGVILFLAVWLLLLKNRWVQLPIGRAVATAAGAVGYVMLGILSAEEAAAAINLPTLILLTGCMFISGYMELLGLYERMKSLMTASGSPTALLFKTSLVTAVASALLTNDTVCVIFTPVVGRIAASKRLNPAPFLLAVATSANIGSACSPIGNPQNIIVALASGLTFLQFLLCIGVVSLLGTLANAWFIAFVYRRELRGGAGSGGDASAGAAAAVYQWTPEQLAALESEDAPAAKPPPPQQKQDVSAATADAQQPAALSKPAVVVPDGASAAAPSQVVVVDDAQPMSADASEWAVDASPIGAAAGPQVVGAAQPSSSAADASVAAPTPAAAATSQLEQLSPLRRKLCLALIAITPIALIVSDRWIGLAWMTILISCLLAIVHGQPPEKALVKIDGILLFFFSGLFVTIAGFNRTGVPASVWEATQDAVSMNTASGLLVFSFIVLVGSNTVSNVPLVLLIGPKLMDLGPHEAQVAWAELAFVSTVAGNLTLVGSVANLIVADRAKAWYNLRFTEYLWVGFPSTLVLCAIGVPIVRAIADGLL